MSNAVLILAEYDENGLVNVNRSYSADEDMEISCEISAGGGKLKAFLWEAGGMKPLCGAFEVN